MSKDRYNRYLVFAFDRGNAKGGLRDMFGMYHDIDKAKEAAEAAKSGFHIVQIYDTEEDDTIIL